MKVSINSKFVSGPYGGGMQFANYLRDFLKREGVDAVNDLKDTDIDIILHVNPFPHLTPEASAYSYLDAHKYKKSHPRAIIIERVNECDERKGTSHVNKLLAEAGSKSDFVVFIASWLRPLILKAGLSQEKPWRVILNGADAEIFNTQGKAFWSSQGKLKIVTHHWSDNPKKGHTIYQKLDQLLSEQKFEDLFEFTYIGRAPAGLNYTNTSLLPPLAGKELAEELKKHHIYITATENEPAGMHHIEGALCGLPLLYINSGALPEYCEGFGLEFADNNLPEKLLEIRERYQEFSERIKDYNRTAEKMAREYLSLFQELKVKGKLPATQEAQTFNIKKLIPGFLKRPIISLYILGRLLMRGGSKGIKLNLAGVLPPLGSKAIVHGGKVKLLHLREHFGDTWRSFNIAYFVSSGLPFAPAIWMKLYKLFGVRVVWNQNGVAYPAWAGGNTDRINSLMNPIHLADYVIFQTEFTKKCADKFIGEYKGPSEILINPVDTKHFRPSETAQPVEPLKVIMSGHHFESRERLKVSLEGVKLAGAKLIVIGNTQEIPKEDWIEVIGKFTQEEAPALYNKGHMLLHLKNLDPCPTFVLEALASGLPVVGLANGGMPELVDSGSGILIPAPEDFEEFHYPTPEEVAEAIIKVKNNLEAMSLSAREQALRFDKERWLNKHEEIFKRLCQPSQ